MIWRQLCIIGRKDCIFWRTVIRTVQFGEISVIHTLIISVLYRLEKPSSVPYTLENIYIFPSPHCRHNHFLFVQNCTFWRKPQLFYLSFSILSNFCCPASPKYTVLGKIHTYNTIELYSLQCSGLVLYFSQNEAIRLLQLIQFY